MKVNASFLLVSPLLACSFYLCHFSLHAQSAIPDPSFEKVVSLRGVGGPEISPDGSSIAFQVSTTDWKNNRYDRELWLVRQGEAPFQLTRTADGSSSSPQWSPDGRWIAFKTDRGDEKQQIYLIRAMGGEAQRITETKEGVNDYRWAPDGKQIAFTMSEKESQTMKDRKERYGDYSVEDAEYRYAHLWIVDVEPDLWPAPEEVPCYKAESSTDSLNTDNEAGESSESDTSCVSLPKPKQLTKGESFTVAGFEWSPDGTHIAFTHRVNPLRLSYTTSDISLLDVETGEIKPLVKRPGYDGGTVWSPDSKWILFYTSEGDTISDYYTNSTIARISAQGGTPFVLAKNLDENISVVDWTKKGIFCIAWQRTKRSLFHVDPNSGETELFANTPYNIWWMDFSKDGETVAFFGQNPNSLTEIYRTELSPFRPTAVTAMSHQIEDWDLGASEVISWLSKDGTQIEGVLHKPPDFDPRKKYPLFVIIHGGPTGIDVPSRETGYVYPVMQWLAKGAVVLQPNYRGSAGYGEKFRSLNVRNLGVGDAWDVLSGVDYLIQKGIVDSTRMGAMGWSQGGYISAFLTTTTDRFRAISVGAGISNWITYYVNTDIHPFTRQYLKATPWDDPDIYAKTSPITTIKQAKTPTLIQHGEFDKRVPIPNAYELFQGLQDVGVETKLIVYKGFGHGISKPKERLAALWHNWQWFAKYIWDEEVVLPLKKQKNEE